MNLILIFSCSFNIEEREPYIQYVEKEKKKAFNICLYSDIYK